MGICSFTAADARLCHTLWPAAEVRVTSISTSRLFPVFSRRDQERHGLPAGNDLPVGDGIDRQVGGVVFQGHEQRLVAARGQQDRDREKRRLFGRDSATF